MQYSNTDQKWGYMLLYRPDVGMIETDNITGRDLGALKQNKEKHSLIGLLDNIRNVTTKLNAARYSNAQYICVVLKFKLRVRRSKLNQPRRRTFHELNSLSLDHLMKSSTFGPRSLDRTKNN